MTLYTPDGAINNVFNFTQTLVNNHNEPTGSHREGWGGIEEGLVEKKEVVTRKDRDRRG